MRKQRARSGSLVAALISGLALITILGLLDQNEGVLAATADGLLQLVAVTAALALLIGVFNLLVSIHLRRLLGLRRGWLYSLFTLLAAVGVVLVYVLDENESWSGDLKGETLSPRLFQVLQITLESALAGLILFFLVYAAYRLLRSRVTWSNLLFVITVLVVLLGWLPSSNGAGLRDWVLQVPATAGARGLLIGVGLGTVVVGIRILTAQDRIYKSTPRN
ncbi:MAG: hypothetical protein H6673_16730 [Anaerolineales bacterium]|nr:hypothetical protein [Anaerolineales bacterium]